MDEPVAAAPAVKATPAENTAPSAAATAPAASGVQTTSGKRLFGILSPFQVDIQQGNFISKEQLAQLKTGMTPEQVRFVLGTPLLNDIFHADRWDYVFRMQKGNGDVISSHIAVHFQDNRLAKIEAGTLPTERDFLSLIAGAKSDAEQIAAPKTDAPKAADAPKTPEPKAETPAKQ